MLTLCFFPLSFPLKTNLGKKLTNQLRDLSAVTGIWPRMNGNEWGCVFPFFPLKTNLTVNEEEIDLSTVCFIGRDWNLAENDRE